MAIPVKSIEELNDHFIEIEDYEIDLIELRLDYLKTINLEDLREAIKTINMPLILTLRKKSEGGFFDGDEQLRYDILKKLISLKPEFIDLEHDSLNLDELIQFAQIKEVKTIISYHDFKKTPNINECKKIIQDMLKHETTVVKFITMANSFSDNLIPLNLINEFKDYNLVSFCMGADGIFSRIFSVLFGAQFTFASIEEKTAPGQISIDEMQDILIRFQHGE
ncbi:MAG: type I 3-dehydroquinate dehydratase [Candidatus Helarchaeota archaeon]